ncbi:MAG TPA: glycosyltransferase family 9 protein [Chitinophagaceae bacterium]|nr:glycosyltransferase family 9 protein [Chitinophagaceae bacterium]
MKKFLVIQTAFTGDVVLATAIIEKLHHYFPESRIDFLLRKGNEGLLENHPFLHDVLIWNKKENKNKNLWALLRKIRKSRYDVVVNMQRFASTGILTAFSGAKEKIGFDKNPLSFLFTKKISHNMTSGRHEVERNNDLIAHLTDTTFPKPRLYPSEKNYEEVKKLMTHPYICITPASVWFTKQYPAEKWIGFINSLSPGLHVFLLGGKTDASLCEMIKEKTKNKQVAVVAGRLSFLSSAALMEKAVMNYTNDSAPLHFASAANAPVSAIFCSTVPAFGYYPLSGKSFVIETKEKLSCRPCSLHGRTSCPLGHFKCAYTIENSQLLDTLEPS